MLKLFISVDNEYSQDNGYIAKKLAYKNLIKIYQDYRI